jgi:metal-responsive CopG/Arc/MetJ family transcriptional regulator
MSYTTNLVRTSVSLDTGTLEILDGLAKRLSVSKAEIMRRAIRKMKATEDADDKRTTPLQAIYLLQSGAGMSLHEGTDFKMDIEAERLAKRYWWES